MFPPILTAERSTGAHVFSDICFNMSSLKFNFTVHLHIEAERGDFESTPATAGNDTPEGLSKTDYAPSLKNSAFCLQLPTGNLIKDFTIFACSFYPSAGHNGL